MRRGCRRCQEPRTAFLQHRAQSPRHTPPPFPNGQPPPAPLPAFSALYASTSAASGGLKSLRVLWSHCSASALASAGMSSSSSSVCWPQRERARINQQAACKDTPQIIEEEEGDHLVGDALELVHNVL